MSADLEPNDPDIEEAHRARLGARLARSFVSADSYGLVLLLLMVTYALIVSMEAWWAGSLVLLFQIVTVWFALRTSRARPLTRRLADLLLAAAAVVAVLNLFLASDTEDFPALFVASSLLYLVAPFAIMRHLGMRREVDLETVLGAVAAYLLIGMFFAFAYRSVAELQTGPFFGMSGEGTMGDDLFFSFVTLSTLGYGNLVPAANPGQTMAVGEAIFGQLFLVIAVSKVITAWRPKRLPLDPGAPGSP